MWVQALAEGRGRVGVAAAMLTHSNMVLAPNQLPLSALLWERDARILGVFYGSR